MYTEYKEPPCKQQAYNNSCLCDSNVNALVWPDILLLPVLPIYSVFISATITLSAVIHKHTLVSSVTSNPSLIP